MMTRFRKFLLTAMLMVRGLTTLATTGNAQVVVRRPYWDNYWRWYDDSYRPYYRRYYAPRYNNYYRGGPNWDGGYYGGYYYGRPRYGVGVGPLYFNWR